MARKQGSVTIPSGAEDGLTLRIAGYGNILHIGDEPGNLFVRCVTQLPPGAENSSNFEINDTHFSRQQEQDYQRQSERNQFERNQFERNQWREDWDAQRYNYGRGREDEQGEYDYGSNQPNYRRPNIFGRRRGRNSILIGLMDAIFFAIVGLYIFTFLGGGTAGIFGAVIGAIGGFFLGYKLGAVCFCI